MATLPYGSWPSPITAAMLVERAVSLSQLQVSGDALYWVEGRPAEAGRQVIVRWVAGEEPSDVLPPGFSARSTVHEYGGGAFCLHGDTVFFSNFADQRLWRLDPGGEPRPLTPEGARYADGDVSPDGARLACVRERHLPDGGVVNDLVELSLRSGHAGLATDGYGDPTVVATGHDFYAAPRWSPTGRLAWLSWDHPRMPWDGTELWLAGEEEPVTGGTEESVSQPRWSPDGALHWLSDRTGWWNLYREGRPLAPADAEYGGPDWVFGQSTYAFLGHGGLVAGWSEGGAGRLGVLGGDPLDLPYTSFSSVRPYGDSVAAIAASSALAPAVVVVDPATAATTVVRSSRTLAVDAGYISSPRSLEFPTAGGRTAHALYYPPAHPDHEGPPGERPPLVVTSHGGPTSQASSALDLGTQFLTSRGIAVVDVDYGGSSGYGRAYRRRLDGQWGVVDVEDCVAAARHLADTGEVDGGRMVVRGSSASGFTALLALTSGVFAAGASAYGVADLTALATDTHKFEARYLDGLIGPWPEAAELYRARSPIHQADRLAAPLIIFQGTEDKVVPPAQAEVLVAALRRAGLPFAYLTFEGEQHGFRRAATIHRVAEAELSFYAQVLGFTPADDIEPVPIERP
ncbi:MAG: prolyl oligopeptidase family serine peptidase [Actinomycetota bacterium]|nr:prolyl oligopeptidase family serine peptidase [Actinomycetota bacterium]